MLNEEIIIKNKQRDYPHHLDLISLLFLPAKFFEWNMRQSHNQRQSYNPKDQYFYELSLHQHQH